MPMYCIMLSPVISTLSPCFSTILSLRLCSIIAVSALAFSSLILTLIFSFASSSSVILSSKGIISLSFCLFISKTAPSALWLLFSKITFALVSTNTPKALKISAPLLNAEPFKSSSSPKEL